MKLPEGNSDDGGRRLRVLLAIDGLGPGGAERQFCLLCRGLKEIADVSVWAFHGGVMAAELEAMGIPRLIGMAEGRNRCQAMGTALSLSSGFRPDIIHSWGWISSFLMEAASRRQGSSVHVTGLVRMGTLPSRKRLRLLSRIEAGMSFHREQRRRAPGMGNSVQKGKTGGERFRSGKAFRPVAPVWN